MDKTLVEKAKWFEGLNKYIERDNILFVGSTFIHEFPINELEFNFQVNEAVYNRGIRGLKISQLKELLDVCVFELYPSRIILNIGEEDIIEENFDIHSFLKDFQEIIERIQSKLPNTKLYIMGILPGNDNYKEVNEALAATVQDYNLEYIDFGDMLLDETRHIDPKFSEDGHTYLPNAYIVVLRDLKRFFRNRMMGFGDVWNMIGNWY